MRISPPGHRDYSRLSCDDGDTQLGPGANIYISRSCVRRIALASLGDNRITHGASRLGLGIGLRLGYAIAYMEAIVTPLTWADGPENGNATDGAFIIPIAPKTFELP
jgi:hypothetical protein